MEFRGKAQVNPIWFQGSAKFLKLDRKDLMEILKPFDERFRRDEKRLFGSEGRTGGATWKPLSPEYAKAKAGRFGKGRKGAKIFRSKTRTVRTTGGVFKITSQRILQATGKLRRSLTMKRGRHLAFVSMNPPSLTVGAQSRIGGFHQAGAGKLPKRDPMQQTTGQQKRLHKVVKDWLVNVKLKRFQDALLQASKTLARRGSRGR